MDARKTAIEDWIFRKNTTVLLWLSESGAFLAIGLAWILDSIGWLSGGIFRAAYFGISVSFFFIPVPAVMIWLVISERKRISGRIRPEEQRDAETINRWHAAAVVLLLILVVLVLAAIGSIRPLDRDAVAYSLEGAWALSILSIVCRCFWGSK